MKNPKSQQTVHYFIWVIISSVIIFSCDSKDVTSQVSIPDEPIVSSIEKDTCCDVKYPALQAEISGIDLFQKQFQLVPFRDPSSGNFKYKLSHSPSPNYESVSQAYVNYLKALYPCVTGTGSTWRLSKGNFGGGHTTRTLLMDYYEASDKGRGVITGRELNKLDARYEAILKLADQEEPPPKQGKRGRPKRSKGRNLYDRFKTWREAILAFAHHQEVPFTNNLGERDLRPWKTKLKVSGCFRTLVGAKRYARIKAFCSTAKKQEHVVFDQLVAIQSGKSFLRLT